MIKRFCDVCGAEIEGYRGRFYLEPPQYRPALAVVTDDDVADVCQPCFDALSAALDARRATARAERGTR